MFGTSVEFFFQDAGVGSLRADYLMGEDVLGFGPIRSLEFPQAILVDSTSTVLFPDHFSRRLRFTIVTDGVVLFIVPFGFVGTDFFSLGGTDDGGVHLNSTILSHAFYLAIEGGLNPTSGLSVQGVGGTNREQIERVFFRAMTEMMPSATTMPLAAAVLCQSAVDLFGANSAVSIAVDQALSAVGL